MKSKIRLVKTYPVLSLLYARLKFVISSKTSENVSDERWPEPHRLVKGSNNSSIASFKRSVTRFRILFCKKVIHTKIDQAITHRTTGCLDDRLLTMMTDT